MNAEFNKPDKMFKYLTRCQQFCYHFQLKEKYYRMKRKTYIFHLL